MIKNTFIRRRRLALGSLALCLLQSAGAAKVVPSQPWARWYATEQDLDEELPATKEFRRTNPFLGTLVKAPVKRLAEALASSINDSSIHGPITIGMLPPSLGIGNLQTPLSGGYIVETQWLKMEGRTVGLFAWRRRIQTELRIIIVLEPAASNQEAESRVSIAATARERYGENYKWKNSDVETAATALDYLKPAIIAAVKLAKKSETSTK